jgi:hypothetical protein
VGGYLLYEQLIKGSKSGRVESQSEKALKEE